MTQRKLKIGIDVGGTFTHAVAIDVTRTELVGKAVVPTTHGSEEGVAAGVVQSMLRLLEEAAISPDEVVLIAHSTTQATNALLEGDVAKVGVLGLGSGASGLRARREANVGRVELGPGAFLETTFRYLDVTGGLDEAKAAALIDELIAGGAKAIVAAEPFSVDRPENENRVVALAQERGVPATATAGLTQLYGLRMRTLTAVINASMLPIMIETANRTADAVARSGIDAPLMVMRSDGGIMDIDAMRQRPILTMLSGPAAGVAAALMYERITNGIFVEVGGTSSDICLIRNGRPEIKAAEIGGRRLFVRTLDVRTVGVAGGSVPRVRRGKLFDVGPRSAHIAGLEYESFTEDLGDVECALMRPKPGDPEDYLALRRGGDITHALTPTGASNLLGLSEGYGRGHAASIQSAFEAAGRYFGTSAKAVATRMLELGAARVAPVVKRLVAEHKIAATDLVMVGGGGGAEAVVPFTARSLGMEFKIARHAEVISAIGVALGILQDSVERTLLHPTESELLALRREAFDRVARMGADPETIEVHVEIDRRERRVRATASGSPQLRTKDLSGPRPGEDELRAIAAGPLGVGETEVSSLGSRDSWLRTFTAERRARVFFGLFRVWRMPATVLDAEGVVRYVTKDAFAVATKAEDAEGQLSELIERYTTWGDGGLVVPEVQLVKPHQIVDLSGLGEANQLLALASAELAALDAADPVTILVIPRS
ncbi:Acetophenone carboxylase gamma subunit [Planctomycetes bacterium Poly30]|uniref:Acetophenone carboxylase gamma subunit n=1 Tax=Saltatorellus ferox TaxID=2528018 RepID=A0A518ERN6_9BACT|nr:Acetophenone carboxylase gamma subunit [Planctomycetes bacterium Poly30]